MREETKVNIPKDNPFCNNCKEKHCAVSLDGTCAMIRVYLKYCIKQLSGEKQLRCGVIFTKDSNYRDFA